VAVTSALSDLSAAAGDPLEGGGEFRLHEQIARLEILARVQKDAGGLRVRTKDLAVARAHGAAVGDRVAIPRQTDRGLQQFGPRFATEFPVRRIQPPYEPGYCRGAPTRDAFARQLALRVQVHVARCFGRRLFAKIEEAGAPVRHAHEHVSAASEAAHCRMRYAQRESHRHGSVHRVAPGLQDRDAHIGGIHFTADHHRAPGPLWLGRPDRNR
jgi:hypothetical protein